MTEKTDKTKVIDTDNWWYVIDKKAVHISCFVNKKPVKGIFSTDIVPDIYMSLRYAKIGKIKLCLKKKGQREFFDRMAKEAWNIQLTPAVNMTIDYMSEKG